MATISFIGDISLNDDYRKLYREGLDPFAGVSDELSSSDLVVGNLECLSEGEEGENLEKRPRLKTDLETLQYLETLNLGMACLAHNHVYDNLLDGFNKTAEFLLERGIDHLGAGTGPAGPPAFLEKKIGGIRFAFLNYVDPDTNPALPGSAGVKISLLDEDRVVKDLAGLDKADFRILLLHWGGKYENGMYPGPEQIKLARRFIDAGADLIIGHHPHTLQPSYLYRDKTVYFSIGNFCFADIRSEGREKPIRYRRWKESAIIKVNFTKDSYSVRMIPFRLENLYLHRDSSVTRRFRHRNLYFKLILFSRMFWYIYYFVYRFVRPVVWEIKRSDPERSLLKRLAGLNPDKIKSLFR